jgi:tricorn protease
MWEMQGELGTSHAYEMAGDIKPPPPYPVGQLACDVALRNGRWTVTHIVRGDSWDPERTSPLAGAGAGVREGDTILAVNGQPVSADSPPQTLLVNQAGVDVELRIGNARGQRPRTVVVKTLRSQQPARYREWVEGNRRLVHSAMGGRVGYVHIPDMGTSGFAEFHRTYLSEVERDALIVDVRFNSGGFVSQMLLEKLARERVGYVVTRWSEAPRPYPSDSPAGPMVCITNEVAGSDGDIFTHVFKLRNLGPVVGTRTWGGVVGITVNCILVDNSMTTQPEYAFWFRDVGFGVENYGTDPTYTVEITPQDHAAGRDPQMDTALGLITEALERHEPLRHDIATRRMLPLPILPPRQRS